MEIVTVNLLTISGKARSKSELYKILTIDGHIYLPPYKYCTVDFLSDIIEGSRLVSLLLLMHILTLFSGIGSEAGDYLKLAPHTRTSNRGSSWISCFRLWWWTILACKIREKGDQQGLVGKSMWVKIIIHSIGNSLSNTAFQDYVETKIYKQQ